MADLEAIADLRRKGAGEMGPDECVEDALGRALAGWKPAEMIALAEAVLRNGLPSFERHQPGEDWPRRALDGEVTELGPDYSGPGGNSLASGVEHLLDARASIHDPAACRRAVVEAILSAVMGEMCAVWGDAHPEGWRKKWEAAEKSIILAYDDDPMIGWWLHPGVQRVQRELWNDLADRIAAHG